MLARLMLAASAQIARSKPTGGIMYKSEAPYFARAGVLVASVLITIAIFGSVAIGLTWDAGVQALI